MGGSSNLLYPGVPFQEKKSLKDPLCISPGRGARVAGPTVGRLKGESHERGSWPHRRSPVRREIMSMCRAAWFVPRYVQQVVACVRELDYTVWLTLSSSLEVLWEKEQKAVRRGRKTPTLSDMLSVIPLEHERQ